MTDAKFPRVVDCALVRPHVALVTLNRPDARNAVNAEVTATLHSLVADLEQQSDVWAIVLTGAGGHAFCSGADLKEVASGAIDGLWTTAGFAGFVNARRRKPWIAAVNGFALAGGFEIALSCDMIVASADAEFGLPEVTRGLLAAAGGAYRLPRVLPRPIALELIAIGSRIGADRAHALGLVNRVVPKEQTLDEAIALAVAVCANAPLAVRESLDIARSCFDHEDATLARKSLEAQERLRRSEDFSEGPRAFIEKRPPRWSGR